MANRPEPLTAAEQADVGRVTRALRGAGVRWKTIERELGLCERHLRRCIGMSDFCGGMSGFGDCAGAVARGPSATALD